MTNMILQQILQQQISTETILRGDKADEVVDIPIIKYLFNNAGSSNFSKKSFFLVASSLNTGNFRQYSSSC